MTPGLPDGAEEALAGCDRVAVVGLDGDRTVAAIAPSAPAELEARVIDKIIERLLRRQAELLGCTVDEARMR